MNTSADIITLTRHPDLGDALTSEQHAAVETLLITTAAAGAPLPSFRRLAAVSGASRWLLKHLYGTPARALELIVGETITRARACVRQRRTWRASLDAVAEALVVHRGFVYQIAAPVWGVLDRVDGGTTHAALLEQELRAELRHQLENWGSVLTVDQHADLLARLDAILDLDRFHDLHAAATGSKRSVERRLVSEVSQTFDQVGVTPMWRLLRQTWSHDTGSDRSWWHRSAWGDVLLHADTSLASA